MVAWSSKAFLEREKIFAKKRSQRSHVVNNLLISQSSPHLWKVSCLSLGLWHNETSLSHSGAYFYIFFKKQFLLGSSNPFVRNEEENGGGHKSLQW